MTSEIAADTATKVPTSRAFDRRLYVTMGILAATVVFVGFSRTLYLRAWFDTPSLTALRYVHGALMTCWYTLFLAQVIVVSRHRVDIHRRLGVLTALTAFAILPVGILTAIAMVSRLRGSPEEGAVATIIAGYDFVSLGVFALLVSSALVMRRRSDVHKRLMTLASMSLLGPPIARLVSDEQAVWLTYVMVLLPVVIDTWRHRRLHPAYGWGGALVLISSQLALIYASSPRWIDFALRAFP